MLTRQKPRVRLGLVLLTCGAAAFALFNACTAEVEAELTIGAEINAIREDAGLARLEPDITLVRIARARSADMAANKYFSHTPPDGCGYTCLMDRQGVTHAYTGETIAWNTFDWSSSTTVPVETWAASPPHLAKLLDCHYERFGTGVVQGLGGRIYFTTIFEGTANC